MNFQENVNMLMRLFGFSLSVAFLVVSTQQKLLERQRNETNVALLRHRARNRIRNRDFAFHEMNHLSENDFKRMTTWKDC